MVAGVGLRRAHVGGNAHVVHGAHVVRGAHVVADAHVLGAEVRARRGVRDWLRVRDRPAAVLVDQPDVPATRRVRGDAAIPRAPVRVVLGDLAPHHQHQRAQRRDSKNAASRPPNAAAEVAGAWGYGGEGGERGVKSVGDARPAGDRARPEEWAWWWMRSFVWRDPLGDNPGPRQGTTPDDDLGEPGSVRSASGVEQRAVARQHRSRALAGRLSQRVNQLIDTVDVIDVDDEITRHYAEIRCALESEGRPIGAHDLLVAAQARARGLVVVTANRRAFDRVPGLRVENWLE